MRSQCTAAKSSPGSPQLEKSPGAARDPVQPKKKKKAEQPWVATYTAWASVSPSIMG